MAVIPRTASSELRQQSFGQPSFAPPEAFLASRIVMRRPAEGTCDGLHIFGNGAWEDSAVRQKPAGGLSEIFEKRIRLGQIVILFEVFLPPSDIAVADVPAETGVVLLVDKPLAQQPFVESLDAGGVCLDEFRRPDVADRKSSEIFAGEADRAPDAGAVVAGGNSLRK